MSRRVATVGRSLNLSDFSYDKLDSCSEVILGLCTTFCVTFIVLAVMFPLFNIAIFEVDNSMGVEHTSIIQSQNPQLRTTSPLPPGYETPGSPSGYSTPNWEVPTTEVPTTSVFGVSTGPEEVSGPSTPAPAPQVKTPEVQQGPTKNLASPELTHFRMAIKKWEGDPTKSCKKLDLDGNTRITLHEFKEACEFTLHSLPQDKNPFLGGSSKSPCAEPAKRLFKELDDDGDDVIGEMECQLGMKYLKFQLQKMGDVDDLFEMLDGQNAGKLNVKDFERLGTMLTPSIKMNLMDGLFEEMDASGDGFIDKNEFKSEAACGEPSGCEGHDVTTDLSDGQLGSYDGVPGVIQGKSSITFAVPEHTELPASMDAVQAKSRKVLEEAFLKYTGAKLTIQNSMMRAREAKDRLAALESGKPPQHVRYNEMTWSADVEDGGKFLKSLDDNADKLQTYVNEELRKSAPWLVEADVSLWGKLAANFYGAEAKALASKTVNQHFGLTPTNVKGGSQHYRCDNTNGPCWERPRPFTIKKF